MTVHGGGSLLPREIKREFRAFFGVKRKVGKEKVQRKLQSHRIEKKALPTCAQCNKRKKYLIQIIMFELHELSSLQVLQP